MTTLHSVPIIQDIATEFDIDTTSTDWHEQLKQSLQQEEGVLTEKMAQMIQDTIKRSTQATIPAGMETSDHYLSLAQKPSPAFDRITCMAHLDMESSPQDRVRQAARFLIRSYD